MKIEKVIINFGGTKALYELVKEYVVYKLDNENENYNALDGDSENSKKNAATLGSGR